MAETARVAPPWWDVVPSLQENAGPVLSRYAAGRRCTPHTQSIPAKAEHALRQPQREEPQRPRPLLQRTASSLERALSRVSSQILIDRGKWRSWKHWYYRRKRCDCDASEEDADMHSSSLWKMVLPVVLASLFLFIVSGRLVAHYLGLL